MKKQKKKIIMGIGIIVVIGIGIGLFYFINQPSIVFKKSVEKIEINDDFDAKSFIKEVKHHSIDDVKINSSKVDNHRLGQYTIEYQIGDKTYNLDVEVVDTKAPTFDIKDLDVDLGTNVKPEDFITNLKDETKTTVAFKEEYPLNKAGEYKVIIVVSDEANNQTEKEATIKIVKDEEKPTLTGLKDLTVEVGHKINYLSGIKAKDNRDPEPKIEVNSKQVNLSKVGTYDVIYTVTDEAGNQNKYTKKVTVVENKPIQSVGQNGNKIVYLTFDDGPSANTAKILNILDKYNAKATFFVTGNGKKYNYLIKQAHDKGHTIGLHTYTHNYKQIYASTTAYFNDLDKIGQMVKGQIGFVPKYIRFPGGASNTVSRHYCKGIMSTLVKEVQNRGYQYYDWNASTGDASGNNVAVSQLIKNGTASHSQNIMILAHDTAAKSTTVQALPKIIEHYQALGYTFKAIDDSSFTPHQHVNN